jgi:hypothetical protein
VKSAWFRTVCSADNGNYLPLIPLKDILCGRETFFRTRVFFNCMNYYVHITDKSEQEEGGACLSLNYRAIIQYEAC